MSKYMLLLYEEISCNDDQVEIVLNDCSLNDIKKYLQDTMFNDPMPLDHYEIVKKTGIKIDCKITLKE